MARLFMERWSGPAFAAKRDNHAFAEHFHSSVELAFVSSGSAVACVEDRRLEILPGQVLAVFPEQRHSFEDRTPCESYMLIFNKEILQLFDPVLPLMRPENPVVDCPQIEKYFAAAVELQKEKGTYFSIRMRALAMLILSDLLPLLTLKKGSSLRSDGFQDVLSFINDNFDREITLEKTAAALNLSQSYIVRFFRERLQTTFLDYVRSLRMDAAKKLLKETDYSMTEVAIRSGYNSIRSFNRNFASAFGVSPSEYRKQCAKVPK